LKCGYVDRNGKRCNGTPKLGEPIQVRIWALYSRKGGNSKKNQIYVYMPKMFQMLKFVQI